MSKFKIVQDAPESVQKDEYVIDRPSFIEEIQAHASKQPKNGLTGAYHLRNITDSIAQNYDPENMTAFSVKVHLFEGRPYSSDKELNKIVVEMLDMCCPGVFAKYLEKKIKTRPKGTKLVYYVDFGVENAEELFYKNGFTEQEQEPKKTVGKPAITNAQAKELKKQNENN